MALVTERSRRAPGSSDGLIDKRILCLYASVSDRRTETGQSLNRLAFSATAHCLTGCAIGQVLGMVIGITEGG